jgi:hypothetical protein
MATQPTLGGCSLPSPLHPNAHCYTNKPVKGCALRSQYLLEDAALSGWAAPTPLPQFSGYQEGVGKDLQATPLWREA